MLMRCGALILAASALAACGNVPQDTNGDTHMAAVGTQWTAFGVCGPDSVRACGGAVEKPAIRQQADANRLLFDYPDGTEVRR